MNDDALTSATFVPTLLATVPEAGDEIRAHLDDNGELLLHLLMPELLRLAVRLFHAGDLEAEERLLAFVDVALRRGDVSVENAVRVSFVEHVGASPGETPEFIATWPPALLAELRGAGG